MNIESKYPYMIFKKEYNGKTYYSIGMSKKDKDGNRINGYMNCRFKNGIELENQTRIYIKNGWIDFYLKDKVTVPYIFVSEFETVDQTIERIKTENKEETIKTDLYSEFGNENIEELEGLELPF